MLMALASFDSHDADFFPAMAYHHRRPCNGGGGGLASSAFHYGAGSSGSSPVAGFSSQSVFAAAHGLLAPPQQQQPGDVFESSLSDEGVSPAVSGAFGTPPPPPRMPVEQVVPDVPGYSHARGAAAAVAGEGLRRRTDRIAFRVRSEEEVLDDGYKWRKYGKKSVKNSPNPRNYYRCSTEGCNVKKRVERDKDDPSYVVTMYEGVHNHVSPGTIYYATQDAASGRFFVAGMHQFGP